MYLEKKNDNKARDYVLYTYNHIRICYEILMAIQKSITGKEIKLDGERKDDENNKYRGNKILQTGCIVNQMKDITPRLCCKYFYYNFISFVFF